MRKIMYLIVLLALIITTNEAFAARKVVHFDFYSENITIHYDDEMEIPIGTKVSEDAFERFYYDLTNTNYHTSMQSLLSYKEKLRLNDFLYYILLRQTISAIFKHRDENYRTLFCWVMLHKSGYRVQLNYLNNDVMLSVFTKDEVYDMPIRQEGNGWFVDLTSYHKDEAEVKKRLANYRSNFKLDQSGSAFSFKIKTLPKFSSPDVVTNELSFVHEGQLHRIPVRINKSVIYSMFRYPELSIKEHAEVPLSIEAYASLTTALGKLIRGKTKYDAVRLILSFTRGAKPYKTDKEAYQVDNLTFTAEETLFYKHSDCEDRSVLFHYLVKELLNLDVIFLDYPGHASTAVLFNRPYGYDPIRYRGQKYSICDPTGPGNHLKPGEYPDEIVSKPYKVM